MFHHEMCLKDRKLYSIRITVGELQMLVGSCGLQKYIMVSCNHKFGKVATFFHGLIFIKGANISGAHCELLSLLVHI